MQGSNPREGFILLFSHSGKMCYIFSLADKLIYKKQGYPSNNKIRLLHRIPIKKKLAQNKGLKIVWYNNGNITLTGKAQ